MGTFALKETKYLSCHSVPKAVVGIDNIVMTRANIFSVSVELAVYLWSKHEGDTTQRKMKL